MTRHKLLRIAVSLTLVVITAGCVSVKESGTKVSAPPVPTSGVAFRSVPEDAEIFVDGQFRGTTPVTLHLASGTHKVELRLDGYLIWERELMVVAGNDTRVAATLQPE